MRNNKCWFFLRKIEICKNRLINIACQKKQGLCIIFPKMSLASGAQSTKGWETESFQKQMTIIKPSVMEEYGKEIVVSVKTGGKVDRQ